MKDYRIDTQEKFRALLEAAERKDPDAQGWRALEGYVRGPLPLDRRGLIAAFHDLFQYTEDQVPPINALACSIAITTKQTVFIVQTTTRWTLLLFQIVIDRPESEGPSLWYDEEENGKYANDQYIAHVDPDGTFHIDGLS